MVETRCDQHHQISAMENKVYTKDEKAEDTRSDICQQAEDIVADEK